VSSAIATDVTMSITQAEQRPNIYQYVLYAVEMGIAHHCRFWFCSVRTVLLFEFGSGLVSYARISVSSVQVSPLKVRLHLAAGCRVL